jgi:DNA modification methylase
MIEHNAFLNDDCFNVIPQIEDKSVQLLFTSVPDVSEISQTDSVEEYREFIERFVLAVKDKVKEDGFIVMCQTDRKIKGVVYPKHVDIINAMSKYGYKVKDYKIIIKDSVDNKYPYTLNYQHCVAFTKKGTIKKPKGDDWQKNTLVYPMQKGPGVVWKIWDDSFVQLIIRGLSKEGDLVFDPFSGSGVVCYNAKEMNRDYIGCELSEDIYNSGFFAQQTVFG